MLVPTAHTGPYLRALSAGLNALAPHEDWIPLRAALDHLAALDPQLSGEILAPSEVDDTTGMPAFVWMHRALAEQGASSHALSNAALAEAEELDPVLAARLRDRRRLREHLARVQLLPASRLLVAAVRTGREPVVLLTYDRLGPDGAWVRVRVRVTSPVDALAVSAAGQVDPSIGVLHLLSRHGLTPLRALFLQLSELGHVELLTRGTVGPLWFPGVRLPPEAPADLSAGLLLHLTREATGPEVRTGGSRDPLAPSPDAPAGLRAWRERRLAAAGPHVERVRAWLDGVGERCEVVRF